MNNKKYERAASALLDAVYTTDEKACQKYGISDRTLRNYRALLADDENFAAFFHTKKKLFDAAWAEELPVALKKGIQAISECADAIKSDPRIKKNPAVIAALAGAVKICAEVHLTGKVIDARIIDRNRPENDLPGEVPAPAESNYAN